jgi:LuxR family quorum sensing-dependent transcriptional regulator
MKHENKMFFDDVLSLTEAINQSSTITEIQEQVLQNLNPYGVEHIFAGVMPARHVSVEEQLSSILFGNWPEEWSVRYFNQGYLEEDPTIAHVRSSQTGLIWNELAESNYRVMNEARDFRLNDGITIPMLSCDAVKLGMSFAGERLSRSKELHHRCIYVSAISTARVLEISRKQTDRLNSITDLTAAEHTCLMWVVEGKTNWEIGKILSISERTVEKHIHNCLKKTNSLNRTQLVANCLRMGVIN